MLRRGSIIATLRDRLREASVWEDLEFELGCAGVYHRKGSDGVEMGMERSRMGRMVALHRASVYRNQGVESE